ncbi:MAG: nucleoside-diphosphate sugar epimerase/dehydratase [Clostridia bacterium]
MSEIVKKIYKSTKKERFSLLDYIIVVGSSILLLFVFDQYKLLSVPVLHYYTIPMVTVIYYLIFQICLKLHRTMWEYAISRNFFKLAIAVFLTTAFSYASIEVVLRIEPTTYLSYYISFFFVCYTLLILLRFWALYIFAEGHRRKNKRASGNENNTMIIGAGWTGSTIAKELLNNPDIFYPVCFLDDDFDKNNKEILDVPIVGKTSDVFSAVRKFDIHKIIFAIPTCDKEKRKAILKECVETKCVLKVVPPIQELIDKSDVIPQTRDVRIEDLLGREPLSFDTSEVRQYVADKICLVTGGGGSIGSELCRQIASFNPKKLIILDIYENNAYDIQQELVRKYGASLDLDVEICSIADYDKCKILFDRFKPQLVFHAAAHKHVPLMETVPEQAIKNNVVGTLNLCKLAIEFNVQRFLLISTDKAVNPTNVMGASKRCCEMILKHHAQISTGTVFCAVRFGNVLGSNGSVIPLFRKQISDGGPITITDKRIIRYFMTIPEAVSLVLETGALSQSGEIFVLDMGEPVKIVDLAENMIRLSGLEVGKDIEIVYTGLRPGEKLFEELLLNGEGMRKTSNRKIFICKQIDVDDKNFMTELEKLINAAKNNKPEEVLAELKVIIPSFDHKLNSREEQPVIVDDIENLNKKSVEKSKNRKTKKVKSENKTKESESLPVAKPVSKESSSVAKKAKGHIKS